MLTATGVNRFGEMLAFVRVVEDGSFSAAARNLSLTPSAISKLVARIEDRLGVLLFRRTHRAVVVTVEGEAFYRAARVAIEAVEATDAAVFAGSAGADTLRVRSMPIFATTALAPRIPAFCARHPALRLEIQLRIDPGNPLDDGMDVAIHVGQLRDSSLVARRFSSTRWIICAAPAYIARHGEPGHPTELGRHRCLNFIPSIAASAWRYRQGQRAAVPLPVDATVLANQASMLRELARTGLGIVRLTELQIAEDLANGSLVELFPRHQCLEEDPIVAVYQGRRHLSPRVRAFLEFLDGAFADPAPWTRWRRNREDAAPAVPAARTR
jgi:DNA-binding transcriptional LysR family regulator